MEQVFREPKVATNLLFKKNFSENIHDATKMVPNQPKKSLKHLGSCESFILPIWQGVLFEGPFLKDLTSTPPRNLSGLETGASEDVLRSFGDEVF